MFRPVVLALVALSGACLTTASAQEPSERVVEISPWQPAAYVGARVGYLEVEGVDEGSFNFGLFGGFEVREFLAIEGSLDYHTAEYSLGNRSTAALQASVRVYPLPILHRFRPYAVGGVGFYVSDVDLGQETWERYTDGGFHAGGGLDIAVPRHGLPPAVFTTFDVRYLYTHKSEDDPRKVEPDGILATVGVKARF